MQGFPPSICHCLSPRQDSSYPSYPRAFAHGLVVPHALFPSSGVTSVLYSVSISGGAGILGNEARLVVCKVACPTFYSISLAPVTYLTLQTFSSNATPLWDLPSLSVQLVLPTLIYYADCLPYTCTCHNLNCLISWLPISMLINSKIIESRDNVCHLYHSILWPQALSIMGLVLTVEWAEETNVKRVTIMVTTVASSPWCCFKHPLKPLSNVFHLHPWFPEPMIFRKPV